VNEIPLLLSRKYPIGVAVGVGEGVLVALLVDVGVRVIVAVMVGVRVTVLVGDGDGVRVALGMMVVVAVGGAICAILQPELIRITHNQNKQNWYGKVRCDAGLSVLEPVKFPILQSFNSWLLRVHLALL